MENIQNMTEDEAMRALSVISEKFGWKVAVLQPEDIRYTWREVTQQEITDKEMEAVTFTRAWRKSLEEAMNLEGMQYLHEIVLEIAIEKGKK
jgi:hypothetical protein